MIYAKTRSQSTPMRKPTEEAESGVRIEQKRNGGRTTKQAEGAYQEVMIAYNERYIIAPSDLKITTSTLN